MPTISRAKLLAAATTVLVLLLACNLELLPLALLVDTIGLDVLALLLGAQLVAVLPWARLAVTTTLCTVKFVAGLFLAGLVGPNTHDKKSGSSTIATTTTETRSFTLVPKEARTATIKTAAIRTSSPGAPQPDDR